jgi:hypothetical protein
MKISVSTAISMTVYTVYQDKNSGSGPTKRENWMLELPPEQAANFGLGPRQFRVRTMPELGDRSVWTDTPADRLRKKLSLVCFFSLCPSNCIN